MTDKDIIQVLQYIVENGSGACDKCPVFPCGKIKDYEDNQCGRFIAEKALDLINHQQAEIERLEKENNILSINADTAFQDGLNEAVDLYSEEVKEQVKVEAVKEFAERLKEKDGYYNHIFDDCVNIEFCSHNYVKGRKETSMEIRKTIDNLVKEMVGENND